jgi:DNA-directed RNA polymerase specialized sigma24 family protein
MSRLSEGDREAFDPLFRALYPRAARLASLKFPEDQAADAAQSIMTRVFSRASEFEAGKPALPWFYAIAATELRTRVRRNGTLRRRTVQEERAHDVIGGKDPERLLLEQELRTCVARAIATLDEGSAEAIACMLDDRAFPNISASAFRKRVSRAYARLRLLLGGLDGK